MAPAEVVVVGTKSRTGTMWELFAIVDPTSREGSSNMSLRSLGGYRASSARVGWVRTVTISVARIAWHKRASSRLTRVSRSSAKHALPMKIMQLVAVVLTPIGRDSVTVTSLRS